MSCQHPTQSREGAQLAGLREAKFEVMCPPRFCSPRASAPRGTCRRTPKKSMHAAVHFRPKLSRSTKKCRSVLPNRLRRDAPFQYLEGSSRTLGSRCWATPPIVGSGQRWHPRPPRDFQASVETPPSTRPRQVLCRSSNLPACNPSPVNCKLFQAVPPLLHAFGRLSNCRWPVCCLQSGM